MKLTILAIIVLTLTGCQYRWTHPNLSEQAFNRDMYECDRDMRQSHFANSLGGAIEGVVFRDRCMEARGYIKVKE